RDQIQMTDDEVLSFLAQEKTVICATNGRDGFPHLMPLWYVVRDGQLWAWTYAKSQKVRNLQRDPRATVQVEAGTEYHLLRGVMFEAQTVVHHDIETVAALGVEIFTRYGDGNELDEATRGMVAKQATKRVGLQFVERSRATWDHRKLATGVY
ncbi:MAG: pyridoxamine 5-phosphate oxidase, partial [Solirubrobacterales bacterium]|nr:pyridoxamine 5-phosphate oxidase [Solirubrobacterales bacterium]